MDIKKLRITQVDKAVKSASAPPRPLNGWIQAIRTALGMTTRQLAERMQISQSTLVALEKSEANDKITLQSLRRAANALDCDVQYTFIPRTPLLKKVEDRAQVLARKHVERGWHSMRLEDQAPTTQVDKKEITKLQKNLLDSNWKHLWD
jgi:predicted DNA-binding mobile mystery protein A